MRAQRNGMDRRDAVEPVIPRILDLVSRMRESQIAGGKVQALTHGGATNGYTYTCINC